VVLILRKNIEKRTCNFLEDAINFEKSKKKLSAETFMAAQGWLSVSD